MSTCMRVMESNLSPCGQPADNLCTIEIPLAAAKTLQIIERDHDEVPESISLRRKNALGPSRIHPMDRGCFLAIDLTLCFRCWREIGEPLLRVRRVLEQTRPRLDT